MSKQLEPFTFSLPEAERDVVAFGQLLADPGDLSEAGDLAPFFAARPQLAALTGAYHLPHHIDLACPEFDLFGNFRCDWAFGDSVNREYAFVEFEDARADSIFEPESRYHERWAGRLEGGFSELVDWFWIVDRYRENVDFRRRFGEGHVTFHGLLVIGRDRHLTAEQADRLRWRGERVSINTHRVS